VDEDAVVGAAVEGDDAIAADVEEGLGGGFVGVEGGVGDDDGAVGEDAEGAARALGADFAGGREELVLVGDEGRFVGVGARGDGIAGAGDGDAGAVEGELRGGGGGANDFGAGDDEALA